MSQLWHVCLPHKLNTTSWRIPLILNRGIGPVATTNRIFLPASTNYGFHCPSQEWWQPYNCRPYNPYRADSYSVADSTMSGVDSRPLTGRQTAAETPTNYKSNLEASGFSAGMQKPVYNQTVGPPPKKIPATHPVQYQIFEVAAPFIPDLLVSRESAPVEADKRCFRADSQGPLYAAEPKVDRDRRTSIPSMENTDYNIEEILGERMRHLRQWESPVGRLVPSDGQEFSVMSYNVLAQSLLECNSYLYQHCSPEVLNWEYRRERLLSELKNSYADIFCMQEVEENHYNETFLPYLKQLGYNGLYKKRTGNKSDGCAIFYKESAFALDTWEPVEYYKSGVHLLDRDNVGIVALLRPLKLKDKNEDDQTRVCVATTHLLFNPKRGDIKLAQLQLLFAEVDRLAYRNTLSNGRPLYHPVILCGDMNSEPQCQIYKFLHTGKIHYAGLPVATMSGQCGGGMNHRCMSYELLPPTLGVTDGCQYAHVRDQRFQPTSNALPQKTSCSNNESTGLETLPLMANETDQLTNAGSKIESEDKSDEQLQKFSSGYMTHDFNLLSVYGHMSNRQPGYPEVTTQHSRANCTVDYIFYSVKKKNCNFPRPKVNHRYVRENNLKLLATYSLLSDEEVCSFGGLPNCISPSDHLPLIAKFLLSS